MRRPNNEWDFFPYEQILDTMLHELCHNEFGPHNADFYNRLDEIRKECEELITKGISGTGEGFDLRGRRLGGFSRQPPLSLLRQNALSAAQSRAQRGVLLPTGPKRIGGDSSIRNTLSPIQAAAMAAERRLHDDLWCASKLSESKGSSESSRVSVSQEEGSVHSSSFILPSDQTEGSPATWQCGACTLLNQPLALACEVCGTTKHADKGVKKSKMWSCKFCTLENTVETERCIACGEWRYSYGPPTATRGPYLGT